MKKRISYRRLAGIFAWAYFQFPGDTVRILLEEVVEEAIRVLKEKDPAFNREVFWRLIRDFHDKLEEEEYSPRPDYMRVLP